MGKKPACQYERRPGCQTNFFQQSPLYSEPGIEEVSESVNLKNLGKPLMSLAIAKVLGYPVSVSIPGLLLAFAASALSGIVAGIYPSFKATQIHPVDIIRS
jgi:hypothetical protein